MPKIIISQFIGLYQTIDSLTSPAIRFPFVVDSPRSFESCNRSSTEIFNIIIKSIKKSIKHVLQVILGPLTTINLKLILKETLIKIMLKKQFVLL